MLLYDQTNRPETLEVEPEEEVDTDTGGRVKWSLKLSDMNDA